MPRMAPWCCVTARALVEEPAKRDVRLLTGMRDTGNFVPVSQRGAREVRPVRIELSSREEIEACLSDLNAEGVDVLINNAGRFDGGLLEDQELDQIYSMAPMLARGHGKIVNNASIAAYVPFSGLRGLLGHQGRRGRLHGGPATLAAGNRRSVLQVVTPAVETDMLAEVREDYEPHMGDTSDYQRHRSERVGPSAWPSWRRAVLDGCSTPSWGAFSTASASRPAAAAARTRYGTRWCRAGAGRACPEPRPPAPRRSAPSRRCPAPRRSGGRRARCS
jgi:hypothetical protein